MRSCQDYLWLGFRFRFRRGGRQFQNAAAVTTGGKNATLESGRSNHHITTPFRFYYNGGVLLEMHSVQVHVQVHVQVQAEAPMMEG